MIEFCKTNFEYKSKNKIELNYSKNGNKIYG